MISHGDPRPEGKGREGDVCSQHASDMTGRNGVDALVDALEERYCTVINRSERCMPIMTPRGVHSAHLLLFDSFDQTRTAHAQ